MDDFAYRRDTQSTFVLGEPSLADAIAAIAADSTLPVAKKAHWLTSMRSIAFAIGRPPQSLPCRMGALRHHVNRINAAAQNWEPKTLANHKSNLKAAINYYMKAAHIPGRGIPLSPEWATIMEAIVDIKPRLLLGGLARYCSGRQITPDAVDQKLIDVFYAHREATGLVENPLAIKREWIKAWNACVEKVPGWPQHVLDLPELPLRNQGPPPAAFPATLIVSIEAYLANLAKPHKSASGKRRGGNKLSTLKTRRRELLAFAGTAVTSGVPIESLTSLEALVDPRVVTQALETYLARNGEHATGYMIDLAWKLQSIASAIGAPPETVNQLRDIWQTLEKDRGSALTEKNLVVIRAVLHSEIWSKVCGLPWILMAEAQRMGNSGPKKALSLATIAVQILILTRAPIRIGNLLAIKLDHNLKRMPGATPGYQLQFPHYDVKNRVDLEFFFDGVTAELIDQYIQDFRPFAGQGQMGDWLFPGEDGKSRSSSHASAYIAETLEERIGLRVTAHQFRHAAAAIILKQKPGEYEFVRRILGHRSITTTIKYYTALESFAASKIFGGLVEDLVMDRPPVKPTRTRAKPKRAQDDRDNCRET